MLRSCLWALVALASVVSHAQAVFYQPLDADIANPERGWMWTNQPFCPGTTSIDFVDFDALRAQNITLVDQVYVLDDYRGSALSAGTLAGMQADFDRVRAEGLKMVPRFTYNWIASCSGTGDAPQAIVELHLDQLRPLFEANQDVIAVFQVSFIGRYGEMHSSTSGHVFPGTVELSPSGEALARRIAETIPSSRSWAVRYPQQHAQLFAEPLGPGEAFSSSERARAGFANHGFAADETDFGTWSPSAGVRANEQAYAAVETAFVPQLGEPGGVNDPAIALDGGRALSDLERFHYSALAINQGDAISSGQYDAWRDQGVFEDMSRRLGYRYRLDSATLRTPVARRTVELDLEITNEGFARAMNSRGVELVLRDVEAGTEYVLPSSIGDIRPIFPGAGETSVVSVSAVLRDGMARGEYRVWLALPDPSPALSSRPEYSIRLANAGIWDAATGAHDLGLSVRVEPSQAEAKQPASLIYHESTIRNRTQFILANADRLSELPFDGITVHIPASWLLMTGERWTYADSFASWIEPLMPVLNDPANGLTENYLMAHVDRPADFLQDWSTTIANFEDLARVAKVGGFVGLVIDNEQYATPLWDWPSSVDVPAVGFEAYANAARGKGFAIGEAISRGFPEARVMFLHGPYIADNRVPNFVRGNQFGAGEFELFGPFYVGMLEGLGDRATMIDGGEVYALRTPEQFRAHSLWRRHGMASSAHDVSFLTSEDRQRHRETEISFGVYPLAFPFDLTMNPAIMRSSLEAALRETDRTVWFYSEEGLSAWERDEFDGAWLDAVRDAKDASRSPRPTLRYSVEDLYRVTQEPFDADMNGVIDEEDRSAVEREARLFERELSEPVRTDR